MVDDMSALTALGLTTAQQRAYYALTLDAACDGSLPAVARSAGVTRAVAAAALDDLVDLGLAIRDGEAQHYVCAPVDAALGSLAAARREQLARAEAFTGVLAARVNRVHERRGPDQLVSVLHGRTQIRTVELQMLRSAREQLRTLDRPPHVSPVPDGVPIDPMQAEILSSGLRSRTIYDLDQFDNPRRLELLRAEIEAGESARVMTDLPLKLLIADDSLALVPLLNPGTDEEPAALLVRSSVLLDSLALLFEALWRAARPIVLHPEGLTELDDDPDLRQLVELLNTGLTEERLARLLGISERTVRRRLTAARETLGATTMFQAGVEAARRGWI